jgi:electron transfer flavoprotein alpha subunit
MNGDVWVFSEKMALLGELIAAGGSLAEQTKGVVIAVVTGSRERIADAFGGGADRVFWLGEVKPGCMVEDFVPTLAKAVAENQPYGILIGSTRRGRAVAGRLAARLDLTAITDVTAFQFENGALQARHMIFGGGAERIEKPAAATVLLATIGSGVFSAQKPAAGKSGPVVELPFVEPEWRVKVRETRARPAAKVNLAAARKVVCVGRGLVKPEDLALVEELARLLGAEVACTRPLAEGLDWLPRERYIGISGATVRPDLYLGVGVSGQAQHTIGMSEARVVMAINKDQGAPIFEQADYGIVDDLYAVVPALIASLKGRR